MHPSSLTQGKNLESTGIQKHRFKAACGFAYLKSACATYTVLGLEDLERMTVENLLCFYFRDLVVTFQKTKIPCIVTILNILRIL